MKKLVSGEKSDRKRNKRGCVFQTEAYYNKESYCTPFDFDQLFTWSHICANAKIVTGTSHVLGPNRHNVGQFN